MSPLVLQFRCSYMADQDHLANQVDADLAPLFSGLKPAEFPPLALDADRRRAPRRRARLSRLSILGSVGALALAGVAVALFYRVPAPAASDILQRAMNLTLPEAPWRAAPAAAPVAAASAPVVAAPAAPSPAQRRAAGPAAPGSTVAEELGLAAAEAPRPVTRPMESATATQAPALVPRPAPPSRLEPQPVPAQQPAAVVQQPPPEPEPPVRTEYAAQCTGPYCVDPAVVFADQALADAYYDAWKAGVPSREVRAVQRRWRPLDRQQTSSREAMLAAYDERIRDIRALTQTWDGPPRP